MTRKTLERWKRLSRRTALKAIGGLALGTAASGIASADESETDETDGETSENGFTAHLRPGNAVAPEYEPASCGAEGIATFHLEPNEKELGYELRLDDVEGVTGIHRHEGSPDENGPHVADLYDGKRTGDTGEFFSLWAQGDITPDDFAHEFDGSVADVVELVRNGDTYLQVHRGETGKEVARGALR
ncbi:CHRD domain-containing protein [Halorussus salinisoli]|uniref:CHRD domain-containing protein n=1 Tax=Halorussus salinisoli TaxID=2558242 RepID=UPI0014854933|nr:CHRD domain-containing protein [Halorussus salinisoli]